jgi:anaphase-promoting complex subunit 7
VRTSPCRAASGGSGDGEGQGEDKGGIQAKDVLKFLCPLLKVVSGGDAAAPRNRALEVATSGFASISRLGFGTTVDEAAATRPESALPVKPLLLYEFEAGASLARSSSLM